MTLLDVSYALRAAADVARAGETLLGSMDRSRRSGLAPILLGVALGLGIGAMIFREETRTAVLKWAGWTPSPPLRAANGVAAEPRVAGDAAQA